jgi:toxin ParE1/3/4
VQLVLHPEAQAEILEAADWYDLQDAGLGDEFLAEIESAMSLVSSCPDVWPAWPNSSRRPPIQRYLLKRFHFFPLAYRQFQDHVLVLAVVHARRTPFYWLARA